MKPCLAMILISLIGASAAAYEHPLNPTAIRNAYFLGSNNRESVVFLSTYKKTLPRPQTGPYIAEMEVRTPFAQVVVSSREHSVGYSPMQAEQDYKKNPDTIQLRIQILPFTVTSQAIPPPACQGIIRINSVQDCFHDFRFRFRQEKSLKPRSFYGVPIYSDTLLIGADIWFTFSTDDIASVPLRVMVSTPDGQRVSTEFDLAALR